jgi:hypothetical protein
MTNLPNSEQAGNLDNLAVTRSEFRAEIGVLLEYIAQALGDVSGTYTTETVDPLRPVLQGEPKIEVGAVPAAADDSTRIPTTSWVKKNGTYVSGTAPTGPADGTLWVDTTTSPYQLKAYDLGGASWDVMSGFEPGTKMLFQQSAAPTGWTKDTTHNNKALRVVSGSVTTGGNLSFTSAFANRGISGTVDDHALIIAELPSHTHAFIDTGHHHAIEDPGHSHNSPWRAKSNSSAGGGGNNEIASGVVAATSHNQTRIEIQLAYTGASIGNTGSGSAHGHGFTGADLDMRVQYVDLIICTRS